MSLTTALYRNLLRHFGSGVPATLFALGFAALDVDADNDDEDAADALRAAACRHLSNGIQLISVGAILAQLVELFHRLLYPELKVFDLPASVRLRAARHRYSHEGRSNQK